MNFPADYEPAAVWQWKKDDSNPIARINRPIAGSTHDKELPIGKHPLQLYSVGSPNGVKVTVMLEELLEAGFTAAEYDAWLINIMEGDQFGSGFVAANPNSKIPALVDRTTPSPTRVFESGAILLYLSEKFAAFRPEDPVKRGETFSWLFWQMASTPYLGGGFGHFYAYAPMKIEYAINRFAMEVKRQLDVLDRHLADHDYMANETYSIADIAIWPWYGDGLRSGIYEAREYLDLDSYANIGRWYDRIAARPAVQRGRRVNKIFGSEEEDLRERHDASDFDRFAPGTAR